MTVGAFVRSRHPGEPAGGLPACGGRTRTGVQGIHINKRRLDYAGCRVSFFFINDITLTIARAAALLARAGGVFRLPLGWTIREALIYVSVQSAHLEGR